MLLLNLARSAALVGTALALDAARKAAVSLAGYLVAGLLMAVSLAFLTLSGYRAICLGLGDVYAALIVGCAYLMVSLITMLTIQMRRR
ncbi:MAG: hypothetical protein Q8M19_06715 [Reyranella sp.]|nr:hypothetical protein [Reyranella sp.]